MRKLLSGLSLTALVSSLLIVPAFAAPACNGSTFDGFSLGSVNGQDGWIATGAYDFAVVDNEYGFNSFGCKTFRVSDAVTSGSFGDWIFTKPITNEAGETSAVNNGLSGGTRKTHFEAQFDIGSTVPGAQQPGLHVSISPDRGDGARMSYLRFDDLADGIHVYFDDYQDVAPFGVSMPDVNGCQNGVDNFVETDIATLDRTLPHTIKFVMDFVDGPRNDVVKIYVDGVLKKTGTSWEDYFRYCEGNPTRPVDSLIIQSRTGGGPVNNPANNGKGYVFDNFTLASGTPPTSPLFWTEEDTTQVKVDWKAVPGATSYKVYHSPDNVTYSEVFSGNALTFTHAVAVNTDNYYRVTALDGVAESSLATPGKYAGTKDIVIDDATLVSDFNASGTATPSAGWTAYHVNDANPAVQEILSYVVGGDNDSVPGAFGAQTFDWTTAASLSGNYDVFVAYICDSSRGTASYNVYSGATQLNGAALTVNQALRSSDDSACGSQTDPTTQPFWKKLGNFPINGVGRVQLVSATGNNIVADAVAFHKTSNLSSSSASSAPASSVASSVSSCSAVSSANLLGYWKLDENGGLVAIDSAGGDNNGANENGPTYVSGTPAIAPNPSALSFDGTDDQVRIANSADFRFGTGAFTVSAFTKGTDGDRSVLGNFSNTQKGWGLYHYASERINFFGYGAGGINDTSFSAPGLLNGQWHHVAGVYTRSGNDLTIKTYYDGVLIGTNTVAVGDITSMSDLLLGKYLLQPNYKGSLDDVRVYARALSDGEVSTLASGCAASSASSSAPASSAPASSAPAVPMCNGMTATIYVNGANKIVGGPQNGQTYGGMLTGTSGNDVIVGTAIGEIINGQNGDDTICALGGPDIVNGNDGNDWMDGGSGNDILNGGNHNDFVAGNADNDVVNGNNGADTLCAGTHNDTANGGNGNDNIDGGLQSDSLSGGIGTDACHRGEAHNSCESIVPTALPACSGF